MWCQTELRQMILVNIEDTTSQTDVCHVSNIPSPSPGPLSSCSSQYHQLARRQMWHRNLYIEARTASGRRMWRCSLDHYRRKAQRCAAAMAASIGCTGTN